jgi:hypothetical protein
VGIVFTAHCHHLNPLTQPRQRGAFLRPVIVTGRVGQFCAVAGAIVVTTAVTATIILTVSMIPPTLSMRLRCRHGGDATEKSMPADGKVLPCPKRRSRKVHRLLHGRTHRYAATKSVGSAVIRPLSAAAASNRLALVRYARRLATRQRPLPDADIGRFHRGQSFSRLVIRSLRRR